MPEYKNYTLYTGGDGYSTVKLGNTSFAVKSNTSSSVRWLKIAEGESAKYYYDSSNPTAYIQASFAASQSAAYNGWLKCSRYDPSNSGHTLMIFWVTIHPTTGTRGIQESWSGVWEGEPWIWDGGDTEISDFQKETSEFWMLDVSLSNDELYDITDGQGIGWDAEPTEWLQYEGISLIQKFNIEKDSSNNYYLCYEQY